jgi:hypothetical protein
MKLIGYQNIIMLIPRMSDSISIRLFPVLRAGYLSPSTDILILVLFILSDIPPEKKKNVVLIEVCLLLKVIPVYGLSFSYRYVL